MKPRSTNIPRRRAADPSTPPGAIGEGESELDVPGADAEAEASGEGGEFLRVTEIFHSIQGESTWIGSPCAFVRLTGCPLRCTWCDTEYACM